MEFLYPFPRQNGNVAYLHSLGGGGGGEISPMLRPGESPYSCHIRTSHQMWNTHSQRCGLLLLVIGFSIHTTIQQHHKIHHQRLLTVRGEGVHDRSNNNNLFSKHLPGDEGQNNANCNCLIAW
jgi:hypothetical protein